MYDIKAARWQSDAHAFARIKTMLMDALQRGSSSTFIDHLRDRLRRIQKAWPQYIKEEEIP